LLVIQVRPSQARTELKPLSEFAVPPQFDTLRLLVVNLVVRVVELKQQVHLHLPACTPDQAIFAQVLGRLPRLIW
jgi:hypothetical protein